MECVRIHDCVLYCGDAREFLDRLRPSGGELGITSIVSDPPYGIGYKHGGGGKGIHATPGRNHGTHGCVPIAGDDEDFDPSPMLGCGIENVALFGADHYARALPRGRWIAWDKRGEPFFEDSFSDVEFVWHSRRGAAAICTYRWKGLACVKAGENGGRRDHPTQKPVGIMVWLLNEVSAGSIVLDPYMGSGTTGVACVRTGRKFVGVEIERRWFDVACRRIEKAFNEAPLFLPAVGSAARPENSDAHALLFPEDAT